MARPPFYETSEQLEAAIAKYFETAIIGEYTITGLALALGFTERKSLIDYAGKEEFVHAVKNAKLRIEQDYEKSLRKHGRSGDIFGLKNFDWKDKTEQDTKISGGLDVTTITRRIVDPKCETSE